MPRGQPLDDRCGVSREDLGDVVKAPVKTGMEQEMKVLYRERSSSFGGARGDVGEILIPEK